MTEVLVDYFYNINEEFKKLTDEDQSDLREKLNSAFEDDAEEKIGDALFGDSEGDLQEKLSKMGDEEKEELKKVVEDVGLMEEIKDNNEGANWSLDQYKQALSISNVYYFKVKL